MYLADLGLENASELLDSDSSLGVNSYLVGFESDAEGEKVHFLNDSHSDMAKLVHASTQSIGKKESGANTVPECALPKKSTSTAPQSPLRTAHSSAPSSPPSYQETSSALHYSETAKDWNDRYQRIVDLPHDTPHQRLQQTLELCQLESAFRLAASRIGRTIIRERSLPNSKKTYRPIDAGGQAGGVKFMEQGIFFKFATDEYEIYGNTGFAMKAASAELLALKRLQDTSVSGLYIPMMMLLDYCGFRLVAMSTLPIRGGETLLYGSPDGGKNIFSKDETFSSLIATACAKLNLKPHQVRGRENGIRVTMHGPADLEGHKGTDGKYYVLDTARLFPPEHPTLKAILIPRSEQDPIRELGSEDISKNVTLETFERILNKHHLLSSLQEVFPEVNLRRIETAVGTIICLTQCDALKLNTRANTILSYQLRSAGGDENSEEAAVYHIHGPAILMRSNKAVHLYCLLRPELVSRSAFPLSSDALSGFAASDPDRRTHNREVCAVTRFLFEKIIPQFVEDLNTHAITAVTHADLVRQMHARGINCRHLGMVRSGIKVAHLQSFLLTEMCARAMKNMLREHLRNLDDGSESASNEVAVSFFNQIFSSRDESDRFWRVDVKLALQLKFMGALSASETRYDHDLRQDLLLFPLFQRLQESTGVRFKLGAQKRLFDHPRFFDRKYVVSISDLDCMHVKLKSIFPTHTEIEKLVHAVVLEEEKEIIERYSFHVDAKYDMPFSTSAFGANARMETSYRLLFNTKVHKRVEAVLGPDCEQALYSNLALADAYTSVDMTSLALDHALTGLHNAEDLFGSFSEVTVQGLVACGEIYEKTQNFEEAIVYYRQALSGIERLYKCHPLVGRLGVKLFFLMERHNPMAKLEAHGYLKQGFEAYLSLYKKDDAWLLVPLLGLENNDRVFIETLIDQTEIRDVFASDLSQVGRQFWPPAVLDIVQKEASRNDVATLLSQVGLLQLLPVFEAEEIGLDELMEMTDEELRDNLGLKTGHRKKIMEAVKKRKRLLQVIERIRSMVKKERQEE
mmetsp:Transcript_29066/g.73052  ORF Transcript_29066/g.73052 Transcript_29066/m.73052 type:complete len:1029 (-) Transcript_29066:1489-4575(-)